MKLLHIADLHLGKRMNDIDLLEDQIHVLRQIREIAVSEKTEAVLIAGDVYQKASPQSEAMTAFNDFVSALAESGIKVFAISGNHDSDRRISYFSALLRKSGVYVSERFTGVLQQYSLYDAYGEVVVSLLPFIRPLTVRRFYPDRNIVSYQDAVAAVLSASPIDRSKRNVLLCHQFITGAELSDSEERTVGGLDNIDASLFDAFDYVALGHIHKPQKLGRPTLRYAGSPLKYSLSEAAHKKSAVLLELREKGDCRVELIPLRHLHDVREVEGMLSDVMKMDYSEDYVRVTVHDELVPPDARAAVSTVFPNMLKFAVVNSKTREERDVLASEMVEEKDVKELFSDFFRLQNNGVAPTEQQLALLDEVLKEMEEKRHEAD